ncbi:hypothetical protein M0811_02610 [Anaeramoeba ignava]|uniref:Fibronectin type-III domain-containing protein n=1 Tax=Anaeramoeba ignava TaxID=1746090 RepID=A0A9Q0R627_ANAIG|nr:hypothetical protein M0811_02610 [Anaeramoeba ignava]
MHARPQRINTDSEQSFLEKYLIEKLPSIKKYIFYVLWIMPLISVLKLYAFLRSYHYPKEILKEFQQNKTTLVSSTTNNLLLLIFASVSIFAIIYFSQKQKIRFIFHSIYLLIVLYFWNPTADIIFWQTNMSIFLHILWFFGWFLITFDLVIVNNSFSIFKKPLRKYSNVPFFGVILILWSTPVLTLDHFLFSVFFSFASLLLSNVDKKIEESSWKHMMTNIQNAKNILFLIFFSIFGIFQIISQTNDYLSSPPLHWYMIDVLISNDSNSSSFGYSSSISENIYVLSDYDAQKVYIYEKNGSNFNLKQVIADSTDGFGFSVSISGNFIVVGTFSQKKIFIFKYNGSDWISEKNFTSSDTYFGWCVSISENFIVSGSGASEAIVYKYNGSVWNYQQTLSESGSYFAASLAISEDVIVIGAHGSSKAFIFRYNGSDWNLEKNLSGTTGSHFGLGVSVSGNVTVIGAYDSKEAFWYRYNGSDWNLEQNVSQPTLSYFGRFVSISGNVTVISAYQANQAFIYRFNETYWNLEQNLTNETTSSFGFSVSNTENNTVITDSGLKKAYIYQLSSSKVNLINCSSLFSSFKCYWNKDEFPEYFEYQINYGFGWTSIQSPNLDVSENVFYQEFNSSFYSNIFGNYNYSIQIKACDTEYFDCSEPCDSFDLLTRIGSVQNLSVLNQTSSSFNISWDYPNVEIISEIPQLDHYLIFYQDSIEQSQNISINNSSLKSFILDNLECGKEYNISMTSCRTFLCEGEDEGEISNQITMITKFEKVENLTCSISNFIEINCLWNSPINCSENPFYYNLSYQSISENDSGNYSITSTNKTFKVELENQEYQINISGCDSNDICGTISTTTIKTTSPQQKDSSSTNTTGIIVGIIVPVVVIGGTILILVIVRKKRKNKNKDKKPKKDKESKKSKKGKSKKDEKELKNDLDI